METNCKKCGKVFITAPYHIYKDYRGFFCSWTCYLHKDDNKGKRKNKRVELWNESGDEVLRVFKNAEDASRETGYSAEEIRQACHNGEVYRGFVWMYRE